MLSKIDRALRQWQYLAPLLLLLSFQSTVGDRMRTKKLKRRAAAQTWDIPRGHDNHDVVVNVLVCTEALCPDCQNFVQKQLVPAFRDLHSIVNLTWIPFGNARYSGDDTDELICQHGPGECDANAWEQCAGMHLYPHQPHLYLDFLNCLEDSLPQGGDHAAPMNRDYFQSCAAASGGGIMSWKDLAACHDDPNLTRRLQRLAFQATPSSHDHVPWVEIENVYYNDQTNHHLHHAICHAYRKKAGGCQKRKGSVCCSSPYYHEEQDAEIETM